MTLTISAVVVACNLDADYYPSSTGFSPGGAGGFFDAGSSREPSATCDDPREGASCLDSRNTVCEKKAHANQACNARLRCDDGAWSAETALKQDCPTDCPSTYTADLPDGCNAPNAGALICEYPEGTCGCAPVRPDNTDGGEDGGEDGEDAGELDAGGGDAGPTRYVWTCVTPEAGCPRTRPRAGAPCVRQLQCDYGNCLFEDGVNMYCSGVWTVENRWCDR